MQLRIGRKASIDHGVRWLLFAVLVVGSVSLSGCLSKKADTPTEPSIQLSDLESAYLARVLEAGAVLGVEGASSAETVVGEPGQEHLPDIQFRAVDASGVDAAQMSETTRKAKALLDSMAKEQPPTGFEAVHLGVLDSLRRAADAEHRADEGTKGYSGEVDPSFADAAPAIWASELGEAQKTFMSAIQMIPTIASRNPRVADEEAAKELLQYADGYHSPDVIESAKVMHGYLGTLQQWLRQCVIEPQTPNWSDSELTQYERSLALARSREVNPPPRDLNASNIYKKDEWLEGNVSEGVRLGSEALTILQRATVEENPSGAADYYHFSQEDMDVLRALYAELSDVVDEMWSGINGGISVTSPSDAEQPVASGETVRVPNVVGMNMNDALDAMPPGLNLVDADLAASIAPGAEPITPEMFPMLFVTSQSIPPGQEVPIGTEIETHSELR